MDAIQSIVCFYPFDREMMVNVHIANAKLKVAFRVKNNDVRGRGSGSQSHYAPSLLTTTTMMEQANKQESK